MAKLEIPADATHERDGDLYKVGEKVQYLEYGEWHDCKDCLDLTGWLEELRPLNT